MIDFVPHKIEAMSPDKYVVHLAKDDSIYTYDFIMAGKHEGFSTSLEMRSCIKADREFLFATNNDPNAYLIENAVVSFDYARYRKIEALDSNFFEPKMISMDHDKTNESWIFKAVSDSSSDQSMDYTVRGSKEKAMISWGDTSCNADLVINTWHLDKQLDKGTIHLLNCILYLHQANLSKDAYSS